MNSKPLPYIFITLLIIILVFLVGVRYGQRVEKTNKILDFINRLPPSPTLPPKTAPDIAYATYENKTCGISFLYPTYLRLKDSTSEARFTDIQNKDEITMNCAGKATTNNKISSSSGSLMTKDVTINGKKISANMLMNNTYYGFSLSNAVNGKMIDMTIKTELFPLFERSLSF